MKIMISMNHPSNLLKIISSSAYLHGMAGLLTGGLLLLGRYDWGADAFRYSQRGYLGSLFFFVLWIPVLCGLLHEFLPDRPTLVRRITVATAVFFSLPYRWLGLDHIRFIPGEILVVTERLPKRGLDWLPGQAFSFRADMPYELLFYGAIITLALLFGGWALRCGLRAHGRSLKTAFPAIFWTGIFLLLVGQTWLHTSQRSPYTYIPTYEESPENNFRYAAFLYPPRQGAVNADYGVFRILEDFFMGTPVDGDLGLIRRSFPFYLSSQFSYFLPPYYVFLVFNLLLWMAACLSAYHFACPRWGEATARFFTALVACGPGFIMFAAQPMNYLAGYAAIIILLALFDRLLAREQIPPAWNRVLLLGVSLGLFSLVYDILFWYTFLLLAGLARVRPISRLLAGLGTGLGIYFGFQLLVREVLRVEVSPLTEQYLQESFLNLASWNLRSLGDWYVLLVDFVRRYAVHLANAFFFIPVMLAAAGAFNLRDRHRGWEIFCLLLPSLLSAAFLHFTQSRIAHLPRLTYPAYPAVYLLSAAGLNGLQVFLNRHGWRTAAVVLPWALLAGIIGLNNCDVFGFPQLYYLFYWESGGVFQ